MKYGIVVDSGCDLTSLSPEVASKIDFTRAPLKLDVGDKEFIDDFNLNIEEFMKEMYAFKGKTGSAAPSPNAWLTAYEKSEYVFAVTLTSTLSGSYASAQTALDMFKEQYPNRKIHLIDSKSAGPEITLIVRKLTEYIMQGMSFEEIVQNIENYREHIHLLATLSSLDNLIKNGRISKLQGSIAGILGIKILATTTEDGKIDLLQKYRGKMTVYDKTIEEMFNRNYNGGHIIIAHCFAPNIAQYISSAIKAKFPNSEIEIMPTSGLCSYYAEQGGILIGFEA